MLFTFSADLPIRVVDFPIINHRMIGRDPVSAPISLLAMTKRYIIDCGHVLDGWWPLIQVLRCIMMDSVVDRRSSGSCSSRSHLASAGFGCPKGVMTPAPSAVYLIAEALSHRRTSCLYQTTICYQIHEPQSAYLRLLLYIFSCQVLQIALLYLVSASVSA